MSTAQARAQQRLQAFEQACPTAARLARYASLAVRLDAALLRRLRLRLLPASHASDEADLWFSDLSESRDGDALVFNPHVAALLRDALATERLPGDQRALDLAFELTRQCHQHWPASLQLEEELVYLALREGDNAAPAIEQLLRPVLAALASGSARGIEIARWAKRALPRLPQGVRNSEAARAIGLATIAHIGSEGEVLAGLADQPLPAQLEWLLPQEALKPLITLACELGAGSLCLRAPAAGDDPALLIELPQTRPLILALQANGGGPVRMLALQVGVPVAINSDWRQLDLRCLNGQTYRVARQTVVQQAAAPRFEHDLFISYAHTDDRPVDKDRQGWVTELASALESVLAQRLGRRPKIWRDQRLLGSGSTPFGEETAQILQRSALLLAVVSPSYVRSAWCLRELNAFEQAAETRGGLALGKLSRLVMVTKLPVDADLPPALQDLVGLNFYERNGTDGTARELSPASSEPDRRAFMEKVYQLGSELARLLDGMNLRSAAAAAPGPTEAETDPEVEAELEAEVEAEAEPQPEPLSVFLSHAPSDRERLGPIVRGFQSAGFEVWLDDDLSKSGDAGEDQTARKIKACVLFIPVISENTDEQLQGLFRREWRLALQRAARLPTDVPFIIPLCLDDLPADQRAVPEAFRTLTWMWAQGGELPEALNRQLARWASDERLQHRAAASRTGTASPKR